MLFKKKNKDINAEEKFYMATQWQLIGRKFFKHKLAIAGSIVLIIFYTLALFSEFFSIYDYTKRDTDYIYVPPQKVHFITDEGFPLRPYVYGLKMEEDPVTWRKIHTENKDEKYYIKFFVKGDPYKLWNLIPGDLHFVGLSDPDGRIFLLGTDMSGRDLFSRILQGMRISMTVGLVGVFFTFILGCIFGGISGYYGGAVDVVVQRVIEFLMSIPAIPLWMALAAALPQDWPIIKVYFAITIILSLVGWTSLARVVRGKFLQLRDMDYIMAARLSGASDYQIITKHLLPGFMSYLIVNITLSIPAMILGETALSFLGIGLRPPAVSLGVLLKDAQNINTIAINPWLLLPGVIIVLIVLAFNFMGDGLRDAADPYK